MVLKCYKHRFRLTTKKHYNAKGFADTSESMRKIYNNFGKQMLNLVLAREGESRKKDAVVEVLIDPTVNHEYCYIEITAMLPADEQEVKLL